MSASPAAAPSSYRERVLPGPLWWLTIGALIAMLSIAYAAALGSAAGLWVIAVAVPVAVVALWQSSPVIEVGPDGITAGRALLPIDSVGSVRVLSGQELAAARRGFDPQIPIASFTVVPPWAPREAVAVSIDDVADPHRAWVLASRHAQALANVIALVVTLRSDGSLEPRVPPDPSTTADPPDSPAPG